MRNQTAKATSLGKPNVGGQKATAEPRCFWRPVCRWRPMKATPKTSEDQSSKNIALSKLWCHSGCHINQFFFLWIGVHLNYIQFMLHICWHMYDTNPKHTKDVCCKNPWKSGRFFSHDLDPWIFQTACSHLLPSIHPGGKWKVWPLEERETPGCSLAFWGSEKTSPNLSTACYKTVCVQYWWTYVGCYTSKFDVIQIHLHLMCV